MNFKRELLEKVIRGEKTQTRRPVKNGQYKAPYGTAVPDDYIKTVRAERVLPGGQHQLSRVVFEIGKDYAACPGRGKPAMYWTIDGNGDLCIWPYTQRPDPVQTWQQSRIRITNIRREDVRSISLEDAVAEGFKSRLEFWQVWCGFYDTYMLRQPLFGGDEFMTREDSALTLLMDRPAKLYDGWALTFELVR